MKLIRFVVGIGVVLSVTACQPPKDAGVDAATGATPHYQHGKIVLPPESKTYEVIGVVDGLKGYVVKYDDTFYRGGEIFSDSAADALNAYGIHTIISVTPTAHEREFAQKNGFALVEVPFEKTAGLSADALAQFVESIEAGEGPFYAHCHGGAHRGGVLGVAYRVHVKDWAYETALVEHGRLGGDLLGDYIMLESVR